MKCDRQPDLDTDDSRQTRQSLLSRLRNWDDSQSWNDFFSTYWKLIFTVARRAGLTEAEAEDVVQQTVIEVSKRIMEFKYDSKRGSFKNWLLQMTRWRIQDQCRKRLPLEVTSGPPSEDDQETTFLNRFADTAVPLPDQTWDAEWEKNLFAAAVQRVRDRVNPKTYQLFDAYVFQEWPMAKVRSLFNVSAGQVRMAKYNIFRMIKTEIKRLEKKLV